MIYSNDRKLQLSGWLKKNGDAEYNSPLKLQKFLFLYECFTKTSGEKADFSFLKGYKRGPVFGNVWGDYTHERSQFNEAAQRAFSDSSKEIDEDRASRCKFIVSTLSENELSDLTHKFNIWKSKEARIMHGEKQVNLYEDDFNKNDVALSNLLEKMYPMSLINNSEVINIDNHYFVFSKQDVKRLTEQHFDTLSALVENELLRNPVFVEVSEEGGLIVD